MIFSDLLGQSLPTNDSSDHFGTLARWESVDGEEHDLWVTEQSRGKLRAICDHQEARKPDILTAGAEKTIKYSLGGLRDQPRHRLGRWNVQEECADERGDESE